jgi:hypothetical protein
MVHRNSDSKQKIFVRSVAGAYGHFTSYVIWCLIKNEVRPLKDPNRALWESVNDFDKYHNFRVFWDYGSVQKLHNQYTRNLGEDISREINFFKQSIRFYPSDFSAYVTSIHSVDPRPVVLSQDKWKLVNISMTETDIQQSSYNWYYKTGYNNYHRHNLSLDAVKTTHGKLLNVGEIREGNYDARLMTFLQAFGTTKFTSQYLSYDIDKLDHYNIKFSDVGNGSIINQLLDLINYLELNPSSGTIEALEVLIKDYVSAQITIPWKLDINDYDDNGVLKDNIQ